MPHPLFGPEVKLMLAEGNVPGLREFCESLHPATVAEALDEEFTPEQIWEVISQANIRTQASIFGICRRRCRLRWPRKPAPDGPAAHQDVARRPRGPPAPTPPRVAESVMRLVDKPTGAISRRSSVTARTRSARSLTTDYAWLPATVTAAEAIDQLRARGSRTIYYIYVLDDAVRRTDGTLARSGYSVSFHSAISSSRPGTRSSAS